ncbi:MAG: DUF4388 domain-containing protein [Desulfosudaceae bacterium]
MKKILVVNIDTVTLNIISSLLSEHTTDFEVLTTEEISEVDEIIKQLAPSVVIIDLENPPPADLKILDYLAKSHPRVIFMVMTAFETGEITTAIKSIKSLQYFEKPVDFKKMADAVYDVIETGVGGQIQGISLTSFLQMSEMEKTTCTLRIKTEDKIGTLDLIKGVLVAAETDTLTNEEAVYEILSWKNPVIEIADATPNKKREIKTPLMNLLIEGARKKDETSGGRGEDRTTVPSPQKVSVKAADSAMKDQDGSKTKAKKGKRPARTSDKSTEESTAESSADQAQTKQAGSEDEQAISTEPDLTPAASDKVTDASQILRKKRLVSRLVKTSAVVLGLVLLILLWQFIGTPWLAERKFNQAIQAAEEASTLDEKLNILNEYLDTDPETRYELKAKAKKQSCREDMEKQAFEEAVSKVDSLEIDENFLEKATAIYESFLKKYPDSGYTSEVEDRLAELPAIVDDAEYRDLLKIPENKFSQRFSAYKDYLRQHPDSTNSEKVRNMLAGLGEDLYQHIKSVSKNCLEEQTCQRSLDLCAYFMKKFEDHRRLQEVTDLRQTIKDRMAWDDLSKKAQEKGVHSEAAKQLYVDYLNQNPRTTLRKKFEDKINEIKKYQQEKEDWRQIQDYARKDEIDIFDRFNRLEKYVNNGPPQRYRDKAREILAWLRQKKDSIEKQRETEAEREKTRREREEAISDTVGKIRKKMLQSDSRYVEKHHRTITDTKTGLTWCMLDSAVLTEKCLDYKAARQYVENLDTGGFDDWRLPSPSELQVIYNSSPSFPAGEADWYWTSEVVEAAWQKKATSVRKSSDGTWRKKETGLDRCGTVRAVRP